MAFWCNFFIIGLKIARLSSFAIDFSCMMPLTPTVMVMRDFTSNI